MLHSLIERFKLCFSLSKSFLLGCSCLVFSDKSLVDLLKDLNVVHVPLFLNEIIMHVFNF